ncbi:tRNA pseudouridine synthase A (Pseudouridylate synthase I) (Pseudouridine synthase I) (Uracil hydrolyase) (PSU-I) [Buchnera aphidicola str. Bp (Baizongia pistaciae)]|uniref:tRNA pseudouridine synthase A n=1 Tax=Buchnera aphidicola subsp. Baizongia pistaciae (strain Bp) TaxID=224915 RepID=TRUA_BUCBP|nr:tRNA pseudouridine(38-40) synthase TruA [Buchnera aphidicola]P59508.1 RecName: Full=tRNA pseudouridine synthase A; AltName: Full=tRNA pseudouridine(38-40) synthase; AltName: Full=tRNA pseudouridylate synthase I; AltName: Full=tRNA-uridine isomerase I [Buchnera aphidicola str. Bp (Baizongia pistaciae)]AAO26917.1 tRNA pseudouridine synthase A (Pseudouridylate synthase I) (Pseudouridine synthase I) (Uracil hydrolyase) (PSU-I) [Buchnera aphidicola str. Bp (Baizongia pistaciae)]
MYKECFKIALGIEYNGSNYHGWQYQKFASSVQEKVELALSIIANHPVRVTCAGRTDAGVHSTGQVVHFCTSSIRNDQAWILGTNRYLPKDISVIWKRDVPMHFHARYSALSRRYRYILYNNSCRSSIFYQGLKFYHRILNVEKMNQAAQYLLGEHDFTTFRSSHCQSKTPFRKILYVNVFCINCLIIIDIVANSFLYHMVRNIVGCLIEIGISKKKVTWIRDILKFKNRTSSTKIVESNGLYLVQVQYSSLFKLPICPVGPFFV